MDLYSNSWGLETVAEKVVGLAFLGTIIAEYAFNLSWMGWVSMVLGAVWLVIVLYHERGSGDEE